MITVTVVDTSVRDRQTDRERKRAWHCVCIDSLMDPLVASMELMLAVKVRSNLLIDGLMD